ncbi:transposase [Streptomyces sp. P9-A2]
MLESALEGGLTDHLGHEPGERAEGGRENYRNGHRSKTVITESGPVEIAVPRDRAESFEPLSRSSATTSRTAWGTCASR